VGGVRLCRLHREADFCAWRAPDLESLTEHGIEYGIPQNPAAPANGNVIFTVTNDVTVATDAILQRADGVQFIVTAGGVLATSGNAHAAGGRSHRRRGGQHR
jgi:uncharacterized phage protein gp47/JayE